MVCGRLAIISSALAFEYSNPLLRGFWPLERASHVDLRVRIWDQNQTEYWGFLLGQRKVGGEALHVRRTTLEINLLLVSDWAEGAVGCMYIGALSESVPRLPTFSDSGKGSLSVCLTTKPATIDGQQDAISSSTAEKAHNRRNAEQASVVLRPC